MADNDVQRAEPVSGQAFAHFRRFGEPQEGEAEQIAKDNRAARAYVNSQIGTWTGEMRHGWEVRNANGTELWVRPDPADPTNKVLIWNRRTDPQMPATGQGQLLGGEQYGTQLANMRARFKSGVNELTNEAWEKNNPNLTNPNFANFGQLNAMDRYQTKYRNYTRASNEEALGINAATNASDTMDDIRTQFQRAGGVNGLNKFKQWATRFETETDMGKLLGLIKRGGGSGDNEIDAQLKIFRDLGTLQNNLGRFGPDQVTGQAASALKTVLGGIGFAGPWAALVGGGAAAAMDALKSITQGKYDFDALNYNLPQAQHTLNSEIWHEGENGMSPGGHTSYSDATIQQFNKAADHLNNYGLNTGSNIAEGSGSIEEEAAQQKAAQQANRPAPRAVLVSPGDDTTKAAQGVQPVTTTETGGRKTVGGDLGVQQTPAQAISDLDRAEAARRLNTGDLNDPRIPAEVAKIQAERGAAQPPSGGEPPPGKEEQPTTQKTEPGPTVSPSRLTPEQAARAYPDITEAAYESQTEHPPAPTLRHTAPKTPVTNAPIGQEDRTGMFSDFQNLAKRTAETAGNIWNVAGPIIRTGLKVMYPPLAFPKPIELVSEPERLGITPGTPTSEAEAAALQQAGQYSQSPVVWTPQNYPARRGEAIASDSEMGAPLGTPNYQIPRLVRQEHVDALQPGTPFYWQDHPDAYVKT